MRSVFLVLRASCNTAGAIVLFPCWWYTEGVRASFLKMWRNILGCGKLFHLGILLKNIFTPLYGYKDWETKFVSMIVRPGHFFCHAVVTTAYIIMYAVPFLLWIAVPPVIVYSILYQLQWISVDLYSPLWEAFLSFTF